MPFLLKNKHTVILLLSLLITLFFSLPSLASLRSIDRVEVETWALQRFFLSLVTGYLLVVPLFYTNSLGKPHLRSRITTRWVRLVIIVIVNLVLVVTLTRLGVLLQEATLHDLPWIGRLRRVYLFRN